MLRFGRYHKALTPGFYWKIPFVDTIHECHHTTTTQEIGPQTIVTKDGVSLVLQAIVKYHIGDARAYLFEVYESQDAIVDLCEGALKMEVVSKTWEEIRADFEDLDNQIAIRARRDVKLFGVVIDKVTITSIAPIRTIRVIQERHHTVLTPSG